MVLTLLALRSLHLLKQRRADGRNRQDPKELGRREKGCRGANQAAILKFGLTETEDKPRVSLSLLENKRQTLFRRVYYLYNLDIKTSRKSSQGVIRSRSPRKLIAGFSTDLRFCKYLFNAQFTKQTISLVRTRQQASPVAALLSCTKPVIIFNIMMSYAFASLIIDSIKVDSPCSKVICSFGNSPFSSSLLCAMSNLLQYILILDFVVLGVFEDINFSPLQFQ